ncbi:aminoglycoside phosphotransferase [Salipiger aestuarii]|uniref:Phosphotransferase family enzyme n=1 Tax=Salipiger aestuarii TaxID=568098 RepID=A0A327YP89_9RHOB|nr:phosphotransferase [Salipiger aestuarii]KAB2543154.1 aminoglycoside phosphotransferase [Salipiger aestuarii]RAK21475.1 phosphotransferase family enzyme [Salipiger aestuarii]
MEMRGDLWRGAMASWPGLARQMAEDPDAWVAAPLARREDARVARILLRLDGPGGQLALKHQARPETGFDTDIAAHLAVQQVWPEGIARLHAVDLEARSCVMDHLPAEPLSEMMGAAPLARQETLLRRAGAWLDGFHRAMPGERRIFQPKFTIRYLHEVMAEVASDRRPVLEPHRFLACARSLCAMAPRYEGGETQTARTHGDLHQRNLMLGADRAWGIDFKGGRVVPVGHDIARLLVDYAVLHAPKAAIPPGEVLPPSAMAAFFEGYRVISSGDLSIALLLRNRVLAEWWGLPVQGRGIAQDRRWHGVDQLAARVFPGL